LKNQERERYIKGSKEFKVNDYITLKLEYVEDDIDAAPGWSTVIYVKDKRFKQCKYLLLNISVDDISSFDKIQSVDEAAEEVRDRFLKKYGNDYWVDYNEDDESVEKIPPEVEFWGHCSNMQVWYENNYDTRLLHRWLAFPLLKELTEAGDPVAKKVFKEEIAKRYTSGHPSVVGFLKYEGYLEYLTLEEIGAIIDSIKSNKVKSEYVTYKGEMVEFAINNKLDLRNCGITDINDIEGLNSLKNLRLLDLSYNQITEIRDLENLKNLKWLCLNDNQIYEIKGLENLEKLEHLILNNNKISDIKGLEKLTNLVNLKLDYNKIIEIKGLENLRNLKFLNLNDNQISEIKGVKNLYNLTILELESNLITEIKGLENLKYLGDLNFYNNQITEIKGLENLRNLNFLNLNNNQISEIKGLEYLSKLKVLRIASNLIPTKVIDELGGLDDRLLRVKIPQNFINYCKKNLK